MQKTGIMSHFRRTSGKQTWPAYRTRAPRRTSTRDTLRLVSAAILLAVAFGNCASPGPLHGRGTRAAQPQEDGVKLGPASVLAFASLSDGRDLLSARDEFVAAMSPFDRAARLHTDRDVSEQEFRKFASQNVLAWEPDEVAKVTEAARAASALISHWSLPFPARVLLVKTTGEEEAHAAYTRQNAIILPVQKLERRGGELRDLILHELFHVLSRNAPELRTRLYRVIGFRSIGGFAYPTALRASRITNPDGVETGWAISITQAGSEIHVVPVLYASSDRYDTHRKGEFFSYLQFKLLVVEPRGESWQPVLLAGNLQLLDPRACPGYLDRIGHNTEYILHPDEILADNFVLAARAQTNVRTPRIIQEISQVLASPAGAPQVMDGAAEKARALKQTFFAFYASSEPEDVTFIGYRQSDGKLKDWSPGAIQREAAFYAKVLKDLEHLGPLKDEQLEIDVEFMLALARYKLHYYQDLQSHLGNIWISKLPYDVLSKQVEYARTREHWEQIVDRVRALRHYLVNQQDNLRSAKAVGRYPNRYAYAAVRRSLDHIVAAGTGGAFFTDLLMARAKEQAASLFKEPDRTRFLQELGNAGQDASQALKEHIGWLDREIGLGAGDNDTFALGRADYTWRLRNVFYIENTPEELRADAEAVQREIQRTMEVKAGQILGRPIRGTAALLGAIREIRGRPGFLLTGKWEEIHHAFESEMGRARVFIEESGLFERREDYNLKFVPMPSGTNGPPFANWPAYIMDQGSPGYFAIKPEARIPRGKIGSLTVHETIPGHYLQSLVWQRQFKDDLAPVRFLQNDDDVNTVSGYFVMSLNMEGYANYVERIMLDAGFYSTPQQELEALVGLSHRAARVIVDTGLHVMGMSLDEAARVLYEQGFERDSFAEAQEEVKERYALFPTQAMTYMVGRRQIEAIRAEWVRSHPEEKLANFHKKFISYGPLPPGLIRRRMLGR